MRERRRRPRHGTLGHVFPHSGRTYAVSSDRTQLGAAVLLRRCGQRLLPVPTFGETERPAVCRAVQRFEATSTSSHLHRGACLWTRRCSGRVASHAGAASSSSWASPRTSSSRAGSSRERLVRRSQVLIQVDDLILRDCKKASSPFKFGKWEFDEAEYSGRKVVVKPDRVLIDQGKYITEQVTAIPLLKERRRDGSAKLNDTEFKQLRSLIYKINWLARESRPEAAGLASGMASRLLHATIANIGIVNKFVGYLQDTADRPLILWKFPPESMVFIVCSDAGGINVKEEPLDEEGLPTDASQGAWAVMSAECLPTRSQAIKASRITWRSSKLRRKVFSTFGGETQAMLQGVSEVEWLQMMYRDVLKNDIVLDRWRESLSPHMLVMKGDCPLPQRQPQCSVTDAKSLFDCIMRENPSDKQDRKSALELAIIVQDLQVDCLTKLDPAKSNGAMEHFLKHGKLSFVDVQNELALRKSSDLYKKRSKGAAELRRLYEEDRQTFLSAALETLIWGCCEDAIE